MAQLVFRNAKVFLGGCDLSGDLNQIAFSVGAKMLNDNTFGDTAESNVAGLVTTKADMTGFWNTGLNPDLVDSALFPLLGTNDKLLTVFPDGFTEGTSTDKGLSLLTTTSSYAPMSSGKMGDLLAFNVKAEARGAAPVRSVPLKDGTAAMVTATGNGTKYQVGAVGASQYLYAGLHVLAYQGTSPTLDVTIQSDADATAGAETTRITFTQVAGATGAQYATRVAGAITDTYWRATWTIGGTSMPGFRFLVWMAIGA